jgi:hypothetical protein
MPAAGRLAVGPLEVRTVPAFLAPVDYQVGLYPVAAVSADFNNDDIADLAVSNSSSGTVSVLLGNGDGTFQDAVNSSAGGYPGSLRVGDFDGDLVLDLVTVGYTGLSVLSGNGDGTFQAPSYIELGSYVSSVAVGDFDGDGKMDVGATTNDYFSNYPGYYGYGGHYEGRANVLLGNGEGGFGPALTTALGVGHHIGAVVADFNGDGKDDFATTDGSSVTRVLLADAGGSGELQAPADYTTDFYPASLAVGDFNGDGIDDLVTKNNYSVSVLLGNGTGGVGDGTFQQARSRGTSSFAGSVAVGDFNDDGLMDLATASNRFVIDGYWYGYYGGSYPYGHYEGDVHVLLGHGNGHFAAPLLAAELGAGGVTGGVASGDFDDDGYADLAVLDSYPNGAASVLLNDQTWSPLPPPEVSIGDATVTEGNTGSTDATFTLTLPFAHGEDLTYHYSTSNYGATAGSDYTAAEGDVTIPAGQTTATITVEVLGDRLAESTEYFAVNISSVGGPIADPQGFGTILDDEPSISIGEATVTEGDTGSTPMTFTVTLSAEYDAPVSVDYATRDLTQDEQYWFGPGATAGLDYTATSGTITFEPGETSKTITVPVLSDRVGEPEELFFVSLSSPGAHLANESALGRVVDNEPLVDFAGDVSVVEGNTGTKAATFTITLSAASDIPVTVNYYTMSGSAATRDYQAVTGSVTFSPGQTSKTVTVLVKGDRLAEYDEDFYLYLASATGAYVYNNWGHATILDNEPRISINSVEITEGNSGTKLMTFTVSLSAAYDQAVTVRYSTQDGSASTRNNDYKSASGTLKFVAGQTTKTFTVTIRGDRKFEYDEYFYVLLSRPSSNALLWESYGWGTILNDD